VRQNSSGVAGAFMPGSISSSENDKTDELVQTTTIVYEDGRVVSRDDFVSKQKPALRMPSPNYIIGKSPQAI